MHGSTITADVPGQVYLGPGTYQAPLTVSSTGTIGGGICDAPGTKTEHISNDGTI